RTPDGVWVVDLLGRAPVVCNGAPVRFARVGDGDVVEVGEFVLRVRVGPPALPGEVREVAGALVPVPRPAPAAPAALRGGPRRPTELAGTAPAPELSVLSLINQFGNLQQQMFQQFQQALLVMSGMFSTLHQDQMGVIREELARVRELTETLHQLQ